jgi:hypothetical protein
MLNSTYWTSNPVAVVLCRIMFIVNLRYSTGVFADVYRSRNNHNLSLSIDHSNTREVRKLGARNGEMVTLLRKLTNKLGDTIDAWDRFQRKDIGYFLFDDELPTTAFLLKCSINAVDNVFLDLRDILRKLRQLEKGLCQDSPQGVSHLFSIVGVKTCNLLSCHDMLGLIEAA